MLFLDRVTAGYSGHTVLRDISLHLPRGSFTALVGKNGCGKSTLLRVMAGLIPASGSLTLDGCPLTSLPRQERARRIALLPQSRDIPPINARTLVEHGRYPHLGFGKRLRETDRMAVETAARDAGIVHLLDRPLSDLSGGERQRVYLAMLLAQDADLLLLDEPTTYLDITGQQEVMSTVAAMHRAGKTVVAALHDLPQAFSCADRVCILREGGILFDGSPDAPAAAEAVRAVFGAGIKKAPPESDAMYDYYWSDRK